MSHMGLRGLGFRFNHLRDVMQQKGKKLKIDKSFSSVGFAAIPNLTLSQRSII